VFAAGNARQLRYNFHPIFDNVLVIGSASRYENNKFMMASHSNYGPDLFACVPCVEGTSVAAPQVTALLALILKNNPTLSVKEAIEHLRNQARPMVNDMLYKADFLGSGVIPMHQPNKIKIICPPSLPKVKLDQTLKKARTNL